MQFVPVFSSASPLPRARSNFTDTSLGLAVTALTAAVDLASFSGILYSIYPPLFGALALYSVGGTAASLYIGRPLVGLNFAQEAAEANFRYGLVRVRENAESIAFYGGEGAEAALLGSRLKAAVDNYLQLLAASRNLSFFTSFYRFAIGILPAAVVAPLFFRGEIEFGVVNQVRVGWGVWVVLVQNLVLRYFNFARLWSNRAASPRCALTALRTLNSPQSSSAFNHILSDVSLIVFQLESLAGFSAVVDRLGQMSEVLDACGEGGPGGEVCALPAEAPASGGGAAAASLGDGGIEWRAAAGGLPGGALLAIKDLSLRVPATGASLVEALTLSVGPRERLLVMGPSGAGKTSLLRAAAGLWRAGAGAVSLGGAPVGVAGGAGGGAAGGGVFFVPQRPYVVLGTLRDQLLYPAWSPTAVAESGSSDGDGTAAAYGADSSSSNGAAARPPPDDAALCAALRAAALGPLLDRLGGDLDAAADWAGALSLGEQQRLALARVLLARPALALLDESTSALDGANEARLYAALADAGVAVVSVGHRPSLLRLHDRALILRGGGAWELAAAADVPLEAAVELAD